MHTATNGSDLGKVSRLIRGFVYSNFPASRLIPLAYVFLSNLIACSWNIYIYTFVGIFLRKFSFGIFIPSSWRDIFRYK